MFVPRHGLQVSNAFHCRRKHLLMRTICSTHKLYSKYLEVEVRIHPFFPSYSGLSTSVSPSTSSSASVSNSSKSYTTLLMPYTQSELCCVNS